MKRLGLMLIGCILGLPLAGHAAQVCQSEAAIPSSTPTSRFTDHGNGTVTDTLTGLMWAQCAAGLSGAGCTTGTASTHTWQAALDLADADAHAGHTDWRLPNVKELLSIVEERCYNPAINLAVFPNTPASNVWSASPSAANSSLAWIVYFNSGRSGYGGRGGSLVGVRLVRSIDSGTVGSGRLYEQLSDDTGIISLPTNSRYGVLIGSFTTDNQPVPVAGLRVQISVKETSGLLGCQTAPSLYFGIAASMDNTNSLDAVVSGTLIPPYEDNEFKTYNVSLTQTTTYSQLDADKEYYVYFLSQCSGGQAEVKSDAAGQRFFGSIIR